MGRPLRYEPARAFRSLHISYRKPMEFVSADNIDDKITQAKTRNDDRPGQLALPSAMRLCRAPTSRYPIILYGAAAQNFKPPEHSSTQSARDKNIGSHGLFIDHLRFNREEIEKITSAFGPLESFTEHTCLYNTSTWGDKDIDYELQVNKHDAESVHNGPRCDGMDGHIWEVKWRHRDDCVTALMTLKRVPHLCVTWAHQQNHYSPSPRTSLMRSQTVPWIQKATTDNGPNVLRIDPTSSCRGRQPHDNLKKIVIPGNDTRPSVDRTTSEDGTNTSSWSYTAAGRGDLRNSLLLVHAGEASTVGKENEPIWSTKDFPPLQVKGQNADTEAKDNIEKDLQVSRERRSTIAEASQQPITSSLVEVPRPPSKPKATHRRSLSHPTPRAQYTECLPSTPELSMSPITPKTSSASSGFPQTPFSATILLPDNYENNEDKPLRNDSDIYSSNEKGVDRRTIFVGGLDGLGPNAWDEDRLTALFRRYGQIEHVKIIHPMGKKSAFAFVKFTDEEGPVRAIEGEHNRVYGNRVIRVQLRDDQPYRSWRMRGKFRMTPRPSAINGEMNMNKSGSCRSDESEFSTRKNMSSIDVYEQTVGGRPEIPVFDGHPSDSNIGKESVGSDHYNPNPNATYVSTPIRTEHLHASIAVNGARSSPFMTNPTSATQPVAQITYYNGQNWIVPYAHTVPFVSLPALPGNVSSPHSTNEVKNIAPDGHSYWNGLYQPVAPYFSFPYAQVPAEIVSNSAEDNTRKPPVSAAGFIQGEMGTLIPVYHPEALNQYLSPTTVGNGALRSQPIAPIAYPPTFFPPGVVWQSNQHQTQHFGFPATSGFVPSTVRMSRSMPQPFVHPQIGSQSAAAGLSPGSWGTPAQMTNLANPTRLQPIAASAIPFNQSTDGQTYQHGPPLIPNMATISPGVSNAISHEQRSSPTHSTRQTWMRSSSSHLTPSRNSNFGTNVQSSPSARSSKSTAGSDARINTTIWSRDSKVIQ